jgi:aminoglycoside/choline kinase family phosphotransferase
MPDQDKRLKQLCVWLQPLLHEHLGEQPSLEEIAVRLQAASSDASFRRYFRWQGAKRSLIIMDAPPPQEDCRPFVKIARQLGAGQLHVPQVLAEDLDAGFLLLSDLGRQTYLDVIDADNADTLFDDAITALLAIQRLDASALPAYDDALLRRELQLFPDWYLKHECGTELNAGQAQVWQRICDLLVQSALAQPRVLVHRDFMPRNLMLSEPNPGVLDFQDAVNGPVTYDITCLFKDAFLSWPQARVDGWLRDYWQRARTAGIPVQADVDDFMRASDLMGVQRHLKVIGIFARICHRDGKPRYLADVPRFFTYIEAVVERRPELAELGELLAAFAPGRKQPA